MITWDCDEIIALPPAKRYHVVTAKWFSCFIWYVCFLVFTVFIVDDARHTHTRDPCWNKPIATSPLTHTYTHRASNWRTIQFIFHCNRRLTLYRLLGSTNSLAVDLFVSAIYSEKKNRNCNTNRPFIDFNRLTSNFEMSIETREKKLHRQIIHYNTWTVLKEAEKNTHEISSWVKSKRAHQKTTQICYRNDQISCAVACQTKIVKLYW